MTKYEFSDALREALKNLPPEDRERSIDFYREMIDDRIEDGMSEAEAVAAIGSVEEVAGQILTDTPLTKLVREKVRSNRKLKVWEIVLIALGSPIWFSLLVSAFAVALSLYVVLWALVICLWAVGVSFAGCAVGGVACGVIMLARGDVWAAIAMLGTGLVCAGLCILLFWMGKLATVGAIRLTKKLFFWIKSRFVHKEVA